MTVQNLHTHTRFSDGKNTAEEMILGAMAAGCTSLGFSEHSPLPWGPDGWATPVEDMVTYRAEILRMREKYGGQIEIFLGAEQDLDSAPADWPYDYVIGSVHHIWSGSVCLSVDCSAEDTQRAIQDFFGGDPYDYAEAYFRRVATVAERTGCRIVGHFDLLSKFNEGGQFFDENHPRYLAAALAALDELMKYDVIFEINTGAISRGYRTVPYPSPALLRAIRDRGGRVCITSDSHSADTILYAFDRAAELAKSCGFSETWVLTKRGFVPQKLYL